MTRTRFPGRALELVLAAAIVLVLDLPQAWAADVETRNYTIQVDGKKAGDYRLTIQAQGDGSVAVSAVSDVRVTVLAIPVYTYSYRGREVWKNGRLQHLESTGKEKGKEFNVRVDRDGSSLHVYANGGEQRVRPDVWTTSCWQLPPASLRNHNVPMLSCDTGAESSSLLQLVGTEQIKVAGQTMTCTHYRVTKDAPHDLWYDAQERLVRDEWMSSGHRTVMEMTDLRR